MGKYSDEEISPLYFFNESNTNYEKVQISQTRRKHAIKKWEIGSFKRLFPTFSVLI